MGVAMSANASHLTTPAHRLSAPSVRAPHTMELLVWATLVAVAIHLLNAAEQARRIVLLGRHLSQYRIEKLMEQLIHGYQRALGESEDERRQAIWRNLQSTENELRQQFTRFVADFARVPEPQARVSRLDFALPGATRVFAQGCFDMRKLLAVHAHGFDRVANWSTEPAPLGAGDASGATVAPEHSARDRAFTMLAEMLLMQHSCHWFCKSKNVASARLLVRHQSSHAQVLAAVTPETRRAYCSLVGCRE